MDLSIEKSGAGIGFRLSGELFQRIAAWEYTIDSEVFEEQLRTGKFKGRDLDEFWLKIMHAAKAEGRIMPRYGVGGSRGVLDYRFRPEKGVCTIEVSHSETGKQLNLSAAIDPSTPVLDRLTVARFKFSFLPDFLPEEKLPEAWKRKPDQEITFYITGKEYEKLLAWEKWHDEEAFSGRYMYRFGIVSLGSGFTTVVEDTAENSEVNLTDYDSW